jgi:hypothetical protein
MLSVTILYIVMLSAVNLTVIMLSAVNLTVNMLSAVNLSVIMLSVAAPTLMVCTNLVFDILFQQHPALALVIYNYIKWKIY